MKIVLFFIIIGIMFLEMQNTTDHSKEIIGNWTLDEGWFPKEDLKFKKNHKEDDYMTFKFNPNGAIEYLHKPQTDCPVGEFGLNDGYWKIENSKLTLQIRGMVFSEYWYWYTIKYNITKLDNRTLELEVVEIIKEKNISPILDWKDLINDN